MSMPPMDPSNIVAKLVQRITVVETALRELRAASGTLDSATIYKGGLTVIEPGDDGRVALTDAGISFWGDFADFPDHPGRIFGYSGGSFDGLTIAAPFRSGASSDATIILNGQSPSVRGNISVSAGSSITCQTSVVNGLVQHRGDRVQLWSDASQISLIGLPTTGSAANLRKDPSTDLVYVVASSRRYKEDIADAVVDTTEVLQLQPRTWVDKGTAERMADAGESAEIPRNVGFIAEELDELPSMRQFVDYIELDGELVPDAIQYDRLAVGLVELAKTQQTQLDDQATAIADLTARLEALETA